MQQTALLLTACLTGIGALASAGCGKSTPAPTSQGKFYQQEGSFGAGAMTFRGPTIWLEAGSPGVVYARDPNKPEQLAYVLVVKHPFTFALGLPTSDLQLSGVHSIVGGADNQLATNGLAVKQGKEAFEFKNEYRLDQTAKRFAEEKLFVDGRELSATAGRVFLVDLTVRPVTLAQVAVPPDQLAAPKEQSEAAVRQLLDRLTLAQERIGRFANPAAK